MNGNAVGCPHCCTHFATRRSNVHPSQGAGMSACFDSRRPMSVRIQKEPVQAVDGGLNLIGDHPSPVSFSRNFTSDFNHVFDSCNIHNEARFFFEVPVSGKYSEKLLCELPTSEMTHSLRRRILVSPRRRWASESI